MYQQIQQLQQHQLHLHPKQQQWICGEFFADISSRHDWSRARESHATTTWQESLQSQAAAIQQQQQHQHQPVADKQRHLMWLQELNDRARRPVKGAQVKQVRHHYHHNRSQSFSLSI
jgi:hypothetical protein